MFSLLSSILNSAKNAFGRLMGSSQMKTAAKIAKAVGDVMRYALPAAEFVASMTPNRADDEIVALLKSLAVPVPADYTDGRPFTELEKRGLLIQAARHALAGQLDLACLDAGAAGLKIAGTTVKKSSMLPGSILDQAAQDVYTMFLSKSASQFVEGQ